MMAEKSITINAPAEQVFAYVADITKHPEWAQPGHKLEIEKTSEGPVGQGSTFRSVGHQFGRNEDTVTITEYAPNQRVVYEASGNAGLLRHTFELAPADGGSQLTKRFEAVQAKFPFSIFLPIVSAFVLPGALSGDLRRIKEKLEAS
jgi:uncharacterized protein YndB with AHSA1/START domain